VGRKSDAIALYQQPKSAVRAGTKLPSNMRHKSEKLSTVIDRGLDWYQSHKPKQHYDASIHLEGWRKALGQKVVAELTPGDVDTFLSARDEWSSATKNRYKATLGRALQLEVVNGRLERNVARLVTARRENNTRVRWLTDDEETRLLAALKHEEQKATVLIAIHSGLRQGEQFALKWSQVDFERRRIVLKVGGTKNGEGREIPMSKTCYEQFRLLESKRPEEGEHRDWVFQSTRYEARLENPKKFFGTAIEKAKIEDFTWHSMRHTFCSRLVMKGVPLRTVMELAGHKNITVTSRYSHLAPSHLGSAVATLDA